MASKVNRTGGTMSHGVKAVLRRTEYPPHYWGRDREQEGVGGVAEEEVIHPPDRGGARLPIIAQPVLLRAFGFRVSSVKQEGSALSPLRRAASFPGGVIEQGLPMV
jgi:hypothetical protein